MPAHVTCGGLVAHRHSFAALCCRTSQYRRTFVPLSVSLWNDLDDPVFDGVGQAGFKYRANVFLLAYPALSPFLLFSLYFLRWVGCVVLGCSD